MDFMTRAAQSHPYKKARGGWAAACLAGLLCLLSVSCGQGSRQGNLTAVQDENERVVTFSALWRRPTRTPRTLRAAPRT